MNRLTALTTLLLTPLAALAAGDRIAILSPDGAAGVKAQLVGTLCVSEDCVDGATVLTGGALDLGKMAREHVGSVVTGKAAGREVELVVLNGRGGQRCGAKVALGHGNTLSVRDLVSVSAQILSAIESPQLARVAPAKAAPLASKHASRSRAKTGKRLALRGHATRARG